MNWRRGGPLVVEVVGMPRLGPSWTNVPSILSQIHITAISYLDLKLFNFVVTQIAHQLVLKGAGSRVERGVTSLLRFGLLAPSTLLGTGGVCVYA